MISLPMLGFVALCLTVQVASGADVQTVAADSEYINGFDLYGKGLFWWSTAGDCSVEFHKNSKISLRGVQGAGARNLASDCASHFQFVVRDDAYVYFVNNGRHYRKVVNALPSDPAQLLPTSVTPGSQLGALVLWNGRLYWTESDGNVSFKVWSVNPDGTDQQDVLLGSGNRIKKMTVFTYGASVVNPITALCLLTDAGNLLRWDINPPGRISTLATGVSDFSIRNETSFTSLRFTTIYAIRNRRELITVNAGTLATSVIYSAPGSVGANELEAVAVDSRNVYVIQQPIDCSPFCVPTAYSLLRQYRPPDDLNNSRPWVSFGADTTSDILFNLRSDEKNLFWVQGRSINSYPTDALYYKSFEGVVGSEWSSPMTDVTPIGSRRFLGQFGAQTVALSLANLPAHNRVTLACDLFIIRSWDGNRTDYGPDIFDVSVRGGQNLLQTTFSTGSPHAYPGMVGETYPPRTGAIENDTLGFTWPGVGNLDSVYHLTFSFDHSNSSLTLEFTGIGLQEIADESWGLDNVHVQILSEDTQPPTIQCPANLTVEATRPCGALVDFTVSATDDRDAAPSIACIPPSGSLFPRGDTLVNCTATDAAGNSAACGFTVTVGGPFPTITDVSPQLIATAGGTRMKVLGTNFTVDDEVLLDGQSLEFQVLVSTGEIHGLAPAFPAGRHDLQIRRCGTVVALRTNACQSSSLPRIFTCEPHQAFARGGNFVTITGTNLLPATQIRIGFPAADGTANLLRNATVSADGMTIIGEVPPLPDTELLGPRDVIAEDARGQDVLPAAFTYLPNPVETDPQVVSLRALQAATTKPLDLTWRNGFPSGLTARVRTAGATPEERARSFVSAYRELLNVRTPEAELTLRRLKQEGLDDVWLAQHYRGVPVFGAEIVVTLSGDEVVALTGYLLPLAELDQRGLVLAPTLTWQQAVEVARADQQVVQPLETLEPAAELMVFDECVFREAALNPHLVWRIKINFAAHEVFVDAHTGEVVGRHSLARSHGIQFGGFDLDIQDAEREANAQSNSCFYFSDDVDVADEDDFNIDYINNADAVFADRFARDCWEFFHRNFDWHSYDSAGSQMEIFIQTSINPGSVASWTRGCDLIQFADGAVDYDVMVHEFTHGIVASTSGLIYQFQSGALDESFADTMGVIADRERGEVETGAPVNWTMAENRRAPQPTGPNRSFDNPPSIGVDSSGNPFPDRMPITAVAATDDSGGVHYNSGIPNKAGYLMINGGSFQGFLVRGMGQNKLCDLKFSALRSLPANATFADARAREIVAAEDFNHRDYHEFGPWDVCTVRNAWAAVGVGRGDSNCDGREDDRNDVDNDLIPGVIDNCPTAANPDQKDTDGDGIGDACDNCPNAFNPGQEDYDDDKKGDVCDDDLDGDGCRNTVDQHPNSAGARIGFVKLCNGQYAPLFGSEAIDTDADTVRDCKDLDDDNDGIPDDQDPCPVRPLPNSIEGDCTVRGELCPSLRRDWALACKFGGCNQLFARFRRLINPDPTRTFVVDNVRIVNRTLYLLPNDGISVPATAHALVPPKRRLARTAIQFEPGSAAAGAETSDLMRLELWSRATPTEPARLVAVVGDYDPENVNLQQLDLGSMLAFTPGTDGAPPTLGATWHIGGDPATANLDTDQDGLVDGWEIRHGLNPDNPNDALLDSDGDGLSNAEEFRAGTDPQDRFSLFRILRFERLPTEFRVEFIGTVGRRFWLEKKSDLNARQWSPVGAAISGRGDVTSLRDSTPGEAGQAFYRLASVADAE